MARKSRWCVWMALVLAATTACRESPQNTPTASTTVQAIEEFTGETLVKYRGKVVLLNFWATWCLPCRNEMPHMEALYREYRDQGVVILAVNAGESSEAITAFVSKLGLTFPIVRDSQRQARDAYGIRFLPTTVFLDRDGQIVTRQVGVMDEDAMSVEIEGLLH